MKTRNEAIDLFLEMYEDECNFPETENIVESLRSYESEKIISLEDYNYIISHWDDITSELFPKEENQPKKLSKIATDLTRELYDEIYKIVDNKPNKLLRLHSKIYAYEYIVDTLHETQIVAIAIFDNELCLLTDYPEEVQSNDYEEIPDMELLEAYDWKTIRSGNYVELPTLLEINGILAYHV